LCHLFDEGAFIASPSEGDFPHKELK